ncbi:MAG: helix-turn-helix domain-containing protein [Limnothrix sp.]
MANAVCYFPESSVRDQQNQVTVKQDEKTPDFRADQPASPEALASQTIRYFPELEGDSTVEDPWDFDDFDTKTAVKTLSQNISCELVLNQAYIEAIAALEDLSEDKKQLTTLIETIISETVAATVHQIKQDPTTVQLEQPQSPWHSSGYLKHLPIPNLDPAAKQKQEDASYEKERHLKLKKIGHILKESRQRQSISRNQLNQTTHVLTRHINALEDGHFDQLPEDLYVKGFIRHLGNALNLNGDALANTLPTPKDQMSAKVIVPRAEQRFATEASRYLGYAALITGAVSGISWSLGQAQSSANPELMLPATPAIDQVTEEETTEIVQTTTNVAPPEMMKMP